MLAFSKTVLKMFHSPLPPSSSYPLWREIPVWGMGGCGRSSRPRALLEKIYTELDELQLDLDIWLEHLNNERPHSGKYMYCLGEVPLNFSEVTLNLLHSETVSER